ncbi:uncharacterized protein [Nicotiana tomentosiformis]|uniref:uncharacterized protein n=1 Tax=Nicotiana tomentosiformis TaxID=4098 RepID=UPI00388CA38B
MPLRATEAGILEAYLQQGDQEVEILSHEIGPLSNSFDEVKAKWAEVQDAILATNDREATAAERETNLEAALNSKVEELTAVEAKYARLEEKYKKTIEHNKLYSSTVRDLDVSIRSARFSRDNLSADITGLKEELEHREASFVVEKTYAMYDIQRKTLEEAKAHYRY